MDKKYTFFDKRTGKIIFESDVSKLNISQIIDFIASTFDVNKKFINYTDDYKPYENTFPYDNDTYRNYMKYILDNSDRRYSRNELIDIYINHYIEFNIKNAMLYSDLKFKWFNVEELSLREHYVEKDFNNFKRDDYLSNSKNKKELGLDIIENGMYWPIIVCYTPEGEPVVFNGGHRIFSLQLLVEEGVIDTHRVLAIVVPWKSLDYREEEINRKKLFTPIKQRLPFSALYSKYSELDDGLETLFDNFNLEEGQRERVNTLKSIEVTCTTYRDLLFAVQSLPVWFKNEFYRLREEGNPVKASNIINDEDVWNTWVGIQKDYYGVLKKSHISSILSIEIELASYCNRKCDWCPNKEFDRTFYEEMEEQVFIDFLYDLREYNNLDVISFNRFNEPMYNVDLLVKRISQIREILGDEIRIVFNTNGDYVTRENLERLKSVNKINMMDYDYKGLDFCRSKFKEWGVIEIDHDIPSGRIYGSHNDVSNIAYRYNFLDNIGIEDRGGFFKDDIVVNGKALKWKGNHEPRTFRCNQISRSVSIDYNGNVMPCCHLRSDNPEHVQYILGNIKEQPLSVILESDKAIKMKNTLYSGKDLPEHCKYCQKPSFHTVRQMEDM